MSAVSVREFSHNPSAMFARAERGEILEVTKHGRVIAVLTPTGSPWAKYTDLVIRGVIRLPERMLTGSDVDKFTHIDTPPDVEPLDVFLAMREEDDR